MPIRFRKHPQDITTCPSDRVLQHWVPAFYQRLWCDPSTPNGAYHWVRKKELAEKPQRCSPRSTFREAEINTMTARGQRNLMLERMFYFVEDAYAPLVSRITSGSPLIEDDVGVIRAFIAAQLVRTPKFQSRIGPLEPSDGTPDLDELALDVRTALVETIEDLKRNSTQIFVMFSFKKVLELLNGMAMEILISDDSAAFITSDAPCVLIERNDVPRSNIFETLSSETAAVLMPLCPRVVAILRKSDGPDGAIRLFPERTDFVNTQNAAILAGAEKYIVSNRKEILSAEWATTPVHDYLSKFYVYYGPDS